MSTLVEVLPLFEGVYDVRFDNKNRFVVPAEFYRVLQQRVKGTFIADPHYSLTSEGIWYKGKLQFSANPTLKQTTLEEALQGASSDIERKKRTLELFDIDELTRTVLVQIRKGQANYIEVFPYLEKQSKQLSTADVIKRSIEYEQRKLVVDSQHRLLLSGLFQDTVTCIGAGTYFIVRSQQP